MSLREVNSTSVQLTWSESFVPANVTIERYTISVVNTSLPEAHELLETIIHEDPPISDDLFSRVFNFDRGLTQCTQITFSVTSTSSIGTSPPSNVTWEMPIDAGNNT